MFTTRKTQTAVRWPEAVAPLLAKYPGTKHPLYYAGRYQPLVMVVLSLGQISVLLAASFGFHLAMDTLAAQLHLFPLP